jgi:hypothetical protein
VVDKAFRYVREKKLAGKMLVKSTLEEGETTEMKFATFSN